MNLNINVNKAKFRIRQVNNVYMILVTYENHSFYIYKGNLGQVKAEFLRIVHNRSVLVPYIQHYFSKYNAAA